MSNCRTPNERVDVMTRMLPYLPLFVALATSSPFWQSRQTGLMGYRLAAYDELPRTGVPELFRSQEEFDAYIEALVKAGVIENSSYIWWAIRPSLKHPTLELRAPDCCTRVEDTIALAALWRTLARRLYRNPWINWDMNAVSRAIVVENKWRAQRYGVHGTFVNIDGDGATSGRRDARSADRRDHAGCRKPRLPRRSEALPRNRRCRHLGRCADRACSRTRKAPAAGCRAARGHRLDRAGDAAVRDCDAREARSTDNHAARR